MRSVRAIAALLLAAIACADPARDPVSPLVPRAPGRALSDGTHGGRAGFHFRPPIAAALASYPGTFDATRLASLAVKVCPIDGSGACTGADVVLTSSTKPALTLDVVGESYGVTWSSTTTGDFRVRIYLGATLLGFADVRVLPSGGSVNAVPAGFVGVRRNASLAIKFRLASGIVGSVTVVASPVAPIQGEPSVGIAYVNLTTQQFTATVKDVDGNVITNPSITWTSDNLAAATVAPNGPTTAVATPVEEGDAIITATSGGVSGTATLFVIADLNTVVGRADRDIPRTDACGSVVGRLCESLEGDVVTDAMRALFLVDFAITNAGGLRNALTCPTVDLPNDFCPAYAPPPYLITRGQVVSVMPFGNRVVTLSVNGAELRTMLENGVSTMPASDGRFPQVSGLCFMYDISAPAGSRVTLAVRQAASGSCTGAPVDLTAASQYTVALNDFIARGGDGYPDFTGRLTFGTLQDRVTALWIASRPSLLPTIQGRIACTTSGSPACPVVVP